MKTYVSTRFAALLLASVMGSLPAFATITSKTYAVTNENSLSIPYSSSSNSTNHQFASTKLGMSVYDNSGALVLPGYGYTKAQNTSTFDITITFSSSFTGTVKLFGIFDPDTTASGDFAVTKGVGTPTNQLEVCASCSMSSYARRYSSATGKYHLGVRKVSFYQPHTITYATVYVWLDSNNRVVFGTTSNSTGAGEYCTAGGQGNCLIQWAVTGYPAGVQHLGHATFTDSQYTEGNFGAVTDDRSW